MIQWVKKDYSDLSKEELYNILQFRLQIFIVEQKGFYRDLDGLDQKSSHFLGLHEGQLVAYGRVYVDDARKLAEIRRVCVEKSFRRNKLGSVLMKNMLSFIDSIPDITIIHIDAQLYLQKFYEAFGFKVVGDAYDGGGVVQINMIKNCEAQNLNNV